MEQQSCMRAFAHYTILSVLGTLGVSCYILADRRVEKTLPAHILLILRGLVLIIPMAFFLSVFWKMTGVWLTYPITELLAALLGFVIYKRKSKMWNLLSFILLPGLPP